MAGLDGRCNLLIQLGSALEARQDICVNGRPGDMLSTSISGVKLIVAYFEGRYPMDADLPLSVLWSTLFELLLPIWPARTCLPSYPKDSLGDVWPCPALDRALSESGQHREEGDDLVAFHKLTQWLCYSLVQAIESIGLRVDRGQRGQTGLPEVSRYDTPQN